MDWAVRASGQDWNARECEGVGGSAGNGQRGVPLPVHKYNPGGWGCHVRRGGGGVLVVILSSGWR